MPIGKMPIEKGSVIGKIEEREESLLNNKDRKKVGDTNRFQVYYVEPKYDFSDIVLTDELKDSIQNALSIYQFKDLIFGEWKLSRVIKRQNGLFINLYGAPGTGKTMIANAIAKELNKKILLVNYADIESKYVGDTSKNIIYMFREAEKNDAVILFDEADALLSKRVTDMNSATDVSVNQTRSVLLHMLDDYEGIVIFTTNFIQNYDSAFMRRIPYHIKFELPNEELRKKLLLHYLADTVPNHINLDEIAKKYEGITGSDIANAVLMSAVKTARGGLKELEQQYFESVLDQILLGKNDNQRIPRNIKVYEREVSEEYALNQIKKGGTNN